MFLTVLVFVHVTAGFVGLAAFWVPILTRKGGKNHKFFGKIFKYSAYLVLSAAMASVCYRLIEAFSQGLRPSQDPDNFGFAVFLGYLAVVTLIGMRHGFVVLERKADLRLLNSPLNRSLGWLSISCSLGLIFFAIYYTPSNVIILLSLSPIGILTGSGILSAIAGKLQSKKAWFYEHMGALIGTGIAYHTAFAVFGSGQLFNLGLQGFAAVLPWIAPALIGIPAIIIWTRYYRRKFGDLAT